jgi:hypothetical protein
MRTIGVLAILLTIGAPSAALSQSDTHTQEDEAACTPDVMRLCQEFVPNRQAIIACMVQKKRDLSPECHAVFSRPPSQRTSDEDRRRRRRPSQHDLY